MYNLYEYVCRHKYVPFFALTCLHVICLFGFNCLGVHMNTLARVQVGGINTGGIDPDKDDVEKRTYGTYRSELFCMNMVYVYL